MFTFTAKHPLGKGKTVDYTAAAQQQQAAIKSHSLNQHQVDTSSIIDVTNHATNGLNRFSTYQDTD
jgi:hypothetical protein